MTPLAFTVLGIAQPQGSARAFTYTRRPEKGGGIGARVDSDNPKLKDWRRHVALAATNVMASLRRGPSVNAVAVTAAFYLPRPKYLGSKVAPMVTRPDLDKLARGICDALTGIVYRDDSQVVSLTVTKHYAALHGSPRAEIRVAPIHKEKGLFDGQKETAEARPQDRSQADSSQRATP